MDDLTLKILGIVIPPLVVGSVHAFLWFSSGRKGTIEETTGHLVMCYSVPIRIFGIVAFVLLGLVIPFLELARVTTVHETLAFLGMSFFGCYVFVQTNYFKIIVTLNGIERSAPWRQLTVAWEDVVKVESNLAEKYFSITTRNGKSMRVGFILTGVDAFVEMLIAKLDPRKYEKAKEGIDLFRSTAGG